MSVFTLPKTSRTITQNILFLFGLTSRDSSQDKNYGT